MSELVADCPRCKASKTTFDVLASTVVGFDYGWRHWHEAFSICRHCGKSTVFVLSELGIDEQKYINRETLAGIKGSINDLVKIERFIGIRDQGSLHPPEFLPENILGAFKEGAACLGIGCPNAAGTMFRLCIDFATIALLPEQDEQGLNNKIRRSLGLRLEWLFNQSKLPEALRDLSHCIKEDGNDGAHEGTLSSQDAEDLADFTSILLERLYTEPKRIALAAQRRAERRSLPGS